MSKTNAPYHLVFSTKDREQTITIEHKRLLYAYIHSILKENECHVYRINGMGDHVHILFDLHPTLSLSKVVQIIKQSASRWMKGMEQFPKFRGWGAEYYAFVVGKEQLPKAIEYVKNQEVHHQTCDLVAEAMQIAADNGWDWYEQDLS